MGSVFVISELGSNWRFGNELENAYRMIRAAKECGADACKFQWASDGDAMAKRRGMDANAAFMYSKYVRFPAEWLPLLATECHKQGIQFGCTVFTPEDVATVSPHVDFVKVSAFEANDKTLREEWRRYRVARRMYVSVSEVTGYLDCYGNDNVYRLHCVSKYPTKLEDLNLGMMWAEPTQGRGLHRMYDGISEHTAHVLTGAVAVGLGAFAVESHVRLHDTPRECPDYGHSLIVEKCLWPHNYSQSYEVYVSNIRTASRML